MRRETPPSESLPVAKPFSNLVDPQHARRDRCRNVERLAQVLLRLADVLVVETAGIELEQRLLPLPRNHLRGERLAAALHTDDQHAARRIEPERPRFRTEPDAHAIEPRFQPVEPSELERVLARAVELQQAAVLDRFTLPLYEPRHVFGRQLPVVQDRPRERLARLVEREPRQRLQHLLEPLGPERDVEPLLRAQRLQHPVQHLLQLVVPWQIESQRHGEARQVARQRDAVARHHDDRAVAAERLRRFLEGAVGSRIGQMRLQILEMKDAFHVSVARWRSSVGGLAVP